jgi:hypothetical protein
MSCTSPLVIAADIFPDMSRSEIDLEIKLMFERSINLSKALRGEISASELAEIFSAQDISIDDWVAHCDEVGERW